MFGVVLLVFCAFTSVWAESESSDFSAQNTWGRDPFTSAELDMVTIETVAEGEVPEQEVEPKKTFSLTGILKRGDRSIAIIDQQLVRVGDVFEGVEVMQIENEKVILKQDDEELELRLG
jgi:hypothetical protein